MKTKASVIFAIFMAAAVFSTQLSQDTTRQKQQNPQTVSQSSQQNPQGNTNTRGISGNPRTNWSKIKDMFM